MRLLRIRTISRQTVSEPHALIYMRCIMHAPLLALHAQAKRQERVWLKRQALGEIDDTLLVDGLTGDKAIYRRRSQEVFMFEVSVRGLELGFEV